MAKDMDGGELNRAAADPERAPWPGRRGFGAGVVAALPILLAVGPFGMIFGVVADGMGLDLAQTMVMTATVIAGASQLAALQLLAEGAPALIAILAGAVVNLRFAMYSAAMALELGRVPLGWRAVASLILHDQTYALTVRRRQRHPHESQMQRLGFYFGIALSTWTVWCTGTFLGATLGERIGQEVDLAFIVPVTFIAVCAPMIRGGANIVAALVAAMVALAADGLPYGLGLLAGAGAGIAAGVAMSILPGRGR